MIKTDSGRAVVSIDGDIVTKTFSDKLMFLKEEFAYDSFPFLCARVINISENMIKTLKGTVLRDWLLLNNSEHDKKVVKIKIIELLAKLHALGYVHCDVHIDNVVIYNRFDVRLIDFEHLRCRSKDDFRKDIDFCGAGYICAFDDSPRSIKTALGDWK